MVVLAFTLIPIVSTGNIFYNDNFSQIDKNHNQQVTSLTCIFDEEVKTIYTTEDTIEKALEEAGIFLGKSDFTNPPADTLLDGNSYFVVVHRAHKVIIIDDGKEYQRLSAYRGCNEILADLNIEIFPNDIVEASDPLKDLTAFPKIIIKRAKPVVLDIDGEVTNIRTQGKIVGEVLAENDIVLSLYDKINPSVDTPVVPDLEIKITRTKEIIISENIEIPYNTIINNDPSLSIWDTRVVQEGNCGQKRRDYKVFYEDGREVKRVLHSEKDVISVKDRIVVKGAETGGASWYNWVGGMTCAHKTLPFGTRLKVTNLQNGASCEVVVADRGPYISGRIIDLSGQAFSKIASLSQGTCYVQIQIIE